MQEDQPRSFFSTRVFKALLVVVAISGIGFTLAASNLIQTFPGGRTGGIVTSSCTGLTFGAVSSDTIRYNCGASIPAFTANPGSATPTFTLGTNMTSLTLVSPASSITTCSPGTAIVTGAPITFASSPTPPQLATGSYDYCIVFQSGVASVGTFTISWA